MAIKGILFDKDGTIVDFKATFEPATKLVLEELCGDDQSLLEAAAHAVRFDLEKSEIADDSVIVAGSSFEIATILGAVTGRIDQDEYATELDERFGRYCSETVAELPGAIGSLKSMHNSGYLLGVATNDAAANAVIQMERLNIRSLFSEILGANSGYGAKPGAGMIEAFLETSQLRPDEVMMVGDSIHDLEAGRAANVITCGVETGPATRATLVSFADHILGSICELPSLLDQLNVN